MKKYIILFRGINVSGKNKIQMEALRGLLKELNFTNVHTYIQSGNIVLDSEETASIECQKIRKGIQDTFGIEVPILARTVAQWSQLVENYPFSLENEKIVAFTFLNATSKETNIVIQSLGEDQYKINGDIVYLHCPTGFARTKLTNTRIEKKLNVIATTRNLRTTLKLLELATL